MPDLLAVESVVAGYGDAVVLEDVSFTLEEGGSLALLGRNGVGKSTLLLTLMGITRLRKGRLGWRGSDLAILPTHRRAHVGIGWVPQERCVFPSLTVQEHLEVIARPGEWTLGRVYQLFPRLEERRRNLVQRFYDTLEPGGYLFLGHSESISKMPVKFQAIVLNDCILYRKPTAEELQKPELVTEGRA